MKFALVSEALPPGWSGTAVLIGRLLGGLDPASYCLLRSDHGRYAGEHVNALAATCHQLPREWHVPRTTRRGLRVPASLANAGLGIASRALQIRRIVKAERCDAILVFTGDFHDPPAAYLASRSLRLPLYFYICDYYAFRELYDPAQRRLSPRLERRVVTGAAGIACGNETLRDTLRERYGVEAAVIHHPCDLSLYVQAADANGPPRANGGALRIVYTGTVYEAQLDALENLLAVLDRPQPERRSELHVYTGQTTSDLAAKGLRGSFTHHEHRSGHALTEVQQAADILFLPLAFRSAYPEVIRTSAPMKFGEYLAAGSPILAHAPAGSFVAEYCRRNKCGLVVDEPDLDRLAEALRRLATDEELRRRLVTNARARAHEEFGLATARSRFAQWIGIE
jgi:glycosyltransferase involved in cell wall biosynthesis